MSSPAQGAPRTRPYAAPPPRWRGIRLRWWHLAVLVLVLTLAVRALLVQSFSVPSGSMQPTIEPGDRLLVNRLSNGSGVHRGDVVVFDGRRAFLGQTDPSGWAGLGHDLTELLSIDTGTDFVKRVVGVPGDHVVCCGADGRLTVNGVAVDETYLFPGDAPSELTFDVTVPPGRIWVMGDHRSDSGDSRSYLGRPGGGMVRLDDVVGQVAVRYWPPGRLGSLGGPGALSTVPAPGAGH